MYRVPALCDVKEQDVAFEHEYKILRVIVAQNVAFSFFNRSESRWIAINWHLLTDYRSLYSTFEEFIDAESGKDYVFN